MEMAHGGGDRTFLPLDIAVLTVSDSRTEADDKSGKALVERLTAAGLFDKIIEGFGELFRSLSYQDIGTSTLQSRATAGVANGTIIFSLPGSSGACRDGWDKLIVHQLDARTRPCNLVEIMPRFLER
jgi:molybdenum cofactor biosynthesis protein B